MHERRGVHAIPTPPFSTHFHCSTRPPHSRPSRLGVPPRIASAAKCDRKKQRGTGGRPTRAIRPQVTNRGVPQGWVALTSLEINGRPRDEAIEFSLLQFLYFGGPLRADGKEQRRSKRLRKISIIRLTSKWPKFRLFFFHPTRPFIFSIEWKGITKEFGSETEPTRSNSPRSQYKSIYLVSVNDASSAFRVVPGKGWVAGLLRNHLGLSSFNFRLTLFIRIFSMLF